MSFRLRLFLGLALAAAAPLAVLALGVRHEMTARLDEEAGRRADALVAALRTGLEARSRAIRERLRTLAEELRTGNRFRLALLSEREPRLDDPERRWLLDWAGEAMRLGGLDLLQLQDAEGRILSSGHFRNEYDRLDPHAPRALAALREPALGRARTPEGPRLALAAVDSFEVAGRRYTLLGGVAIDSTAGGFPIAGLPGEAGIAVALELPGRGTASPAAGERAVLHTIDLPYIDWVEAGTDPAPDDSALAALGAARLVITRDPAPLEALRRRVTRWVALALGLTLLLALGLALRLAAWVSRPLVALAETTARLDLDRLDQEFASGAAGRDDEIGTLAATLDAMTARLRAGAARLREAERRAAVGDLARQVNHDIKNGLAPIRHVLRHLAQVAEREPERLAGIFRERRGTIESSVGYLEGLARSYARLSPALDRGLTDANGVLRELARSATAGGGGGDGTRIETRLAESLPPVRADGVALRRILENLVSNALDALEAKPGTVTLASEAVAGGPGSAPMVRLSVADTGRGMAREELERAFDDFFTTKEQGTGLGLSVVRRLVIDLGGSLRVETAPGQGSRFVVELPAAGEQG